MTAEDLNRQIFEKYYLNNLLPTALGGDTSTAFFKLLTAFESIQNLLKDEANVSEEWIGKPTWFTKNLQSIFKIPRFSGESDRTYYDRLVDLTDISQDKNGVYLVIHSLLGDAIDDPDIQVDIIFTSSVAGTWGTDLESGTWDIYWNNDPEDLWGDTNDTLRADVRIDITFNNSGVNTDPLNYEYWVLEENITKIAEMVNLAKPPGITYEINLISPLKTTYTVNSPSNGATGVATDTLLDFGSVAGATKYQVQLATNPNQVDIEHGTPDNVIAHYPLDGDVKDYSGSDALGTDLLAHYKLNKDVLDSSGNGYDGVLEDGLVAHYKLNGDVTDSGDNGYDGTNNGVSFVTGKINQAGDFEYSEGDYIDLPSLQSFSSLSISFWLKMESDTGNDAHVIDLRNGNSRIRVIYDTSANLIRIFVVNSSGTSIDDFSSDLNDGNWHNIVITWDGSNVSWYVDNSIIDTLSLSGTIDFSSFADYGRIGQGSSGTSAFDGLIDDVRIYDKALADDTISKIYNSGSGTEDRVFFVSGKINEAGDFEAENNDKITITSSGTLQNLGLDDMVVSLWINIDTNQVDAESDIIGTESSAGAGQQKGWFFRHDNSNSRLQFYINDGTGNNGKNVTVSFTSKGSWVHVLLLVDRTNDIMKIYLDNTEKGSTDISGYGTFETSKDLELGWINNSGRRTKGKVDDVRIYTDTLTDKEISRIYNSGSGTEIAPSGPFDGVLNDGLIAHYKLNGDVTDSSGNGYDGNNNGVSFVSGKINQAGDFEESESDYISLPNYQSFSAFSFSCWFKLESTPSADRRIIELNSGSNSRYIVWISNGSGNVLKSRITNSAGTAKDVIWTTPSNDTWYHLAVTWDGSTIKMYIDNSEVDSDSQSGTLDLSSMTSAFLGALSAGSQYWDGLIDDVRIYNKQLSPDTISKIYNDESGTERNVFFTSGQVDLAGDFNASENNYIQITESALDTVFNSDWSISIWLPSVVDNNDFQAIISKGDGLTSISNTGWRLFIDQDAQLNVYFIDSSSTAVTDDNVYQFTVGLDYHLIMTVDVDNEAKVYINGSLEKTIDISTLNGDFETTTNIVIGINSNGFANFGYDSQQDEVRIYDRVLTADEIENLASQRTKMHEITDTDLKVYFLDQSTTYYWRFRPYVNSTWHSWSNWFSFTTA